MKKRIEEVYLITLGYTSDILWKILQVYEYTEKYNKKKGKDKKMGYDLHITRAGSSPINRGQRKERKSQVEIWDDQEI